MNLNLSQVPRGNSEELSFESFRKLHKFARTPKYAEAAAMEMRENACMYSALQ